MHHNDVQQNDRPTLPGIFNVVLFGAQCLATCVTPFSRHTFGIEALSWNAIVAFVGMQVYAAHIYSVAIARYTWAWALALIIQRIRSLWADRRRIDIHSKYSGWPWLTLLLPFVQTYRQARAVEIFVCFAVAVSLYPLSEELGEMLVYASGGLFFVECAERRFIEVEQRRMRDAAIEMRIRSQYLRGEVHDV